MCVIWEKNVVILLTEFQCHLSIIEHGFCPFPPSLFKGELIFFPNNNGGVWYFDFSKGGGGGDFLTNADLHSKIKIKFPESIKY